MGKWAVLLAIGLCPGGHASAREQGVLFLTSGPCVSGILDFARSRGIEVWRGDEIEPERDESEIVMCAIGPCGAQLFLRSNRLSVEREIQVYLNSDQARRDKNSNLLNKSPACFANRIVFEKNAR